MKVRVTITMVKEFDAQEDDYEMNDGDEFDYDFVAEKEEELFNDDPVTYVSDEVWLDKATYKIERVRG